MVQSFIKREADVFRTLVLRLQILIASSTRDDPLFSASINGGEGSVGILNLFITLILFFKGVFTVIEHANFNLIQLS